MSGIQESVQTCEPGRAAVVVHDGDDIVRLILTHGEDDDITSVGLDADQARTLGVALIGAAAEIDYDEREGAER